MDQYNVDMYIMEVGNRFPDVHVPELRETLLTLDEQAFNAVKKVKYKNPTVALLLSIFMGIYGADRFYLGQIGFGFLKIFTCAGLGIWGVLDWFNIIHLVKEHNYKIILKHLAQ